MAIRLANKQHGSGVILIKQRRGRCRAGDEEEHDDEDEEELPQT